MNKVKGFVSGLVLAGSLVAGVVGVAGGSGTVSAASSCTVTSVLKVGSRGEEVRCVEQAVSARGLLRATYVDAFYGTATAKAVKAVEQQIGRPSRARKGVVDAQVASWLGLAPVASGGLVAPVTTVPAPPIAPATPAVPAVRVSPSLSPVEQLAVATLGAQRWAIVAPMVTLSVGAVSIRCGSRACAGETSMGGIGQPSVVVVSQATLTASAGPALLAHELAHAVVYFLTARGDLFAAQQAAYAGSNGLSVEQVDELIADAVASRWLGRPVTSGAYSYGAATQTPAIVALVDAVLAITG